MNQASHTFAGLSVISHTLISVDVCAAAATCAPPPLGFTALRITTANAVAEFKNKIISGLRGLGASTSICKFAALVAISFGAAPITALAQTSSAIEWKVSDGGNGHWYEVRSSGYLRNDARNWQALHDWAAQHGAALCSIGAAGENGFVTQQVNSWFPNGDAWSYLGATQDAAQLCSASSWVWIDKTPWSFQNWKEDQPNCGSRNGVVDEPRLAICNTSGLWGDWSAIELTTGVIEWSADCNGDGIVDYGQIQRGELPDTNGNGVPDCCENGGNCDADADGVPDFRDNCVNIANPSQADCDNDGIGDACELAGTSPYPGAVQWTVASGGNGHWYAAKANSESLTWPQARDLAVAMGGHLATISSETENIFVGNLSRNVVWNGVYGPWLGGFQQPNSCEPKCGWTWVTGELWNYMPPSWDLFDNGNGGRNENFLQYFIQVSQWNDIPEDGDNSIKGYMVEWESGLTTESDCNANGIPDSCEIANGGDCNNNGLLDACEIANHTATDCNNNGIPDTCDIANNTDGDCDGDGILNSCEIAAGALDADLNGVPDGCEGDCNANGQLDYLDIAAGAADCNGNLMIDSCEDGSGIYRNSGNLGNIGSGVPRSVTFATFPAAVTNVTLEVSARANLSATNRFLIMKLNGGASTYLFQTTGTDCPSTANTYTRTFTASEFNTLTASGSLDVAFTAPGTVNAASCGSNALLQVRLAYEQTFTDCDNDGIRDFCAIASGAVKDCNRNGIPDSCDIASGFAKDCNGNNIPDSCDIATGLAPDCNSNGIPDSCDPDSDGDGIIDACDPCPNVAGPCNGCPLNVCGDCGTAADADGDGTANCIDNDDDNDGVVDSMDAFPLDASESVDTDHDGIGDNADQDDDGDGVDDATDLCPLDATKSAPGQCGCGVPDTDTDGDGVADCVDNCPAVANPSQTDCDGNGIGEACETFTDCNANGIPDSCDLASGFAQDCNGNGIPDSCDLAVSGSPYPGAVQWTVASGGNGHWYSVLAETHFWADAKIRAEQLGGYLATTTSQEELVFVKTLLPYKRDDGLYGDLFIGANRINNTSPWQWVTSEPFVFTAWIPGQPDNGPESLYLEIIGTPESSCCFGGMNDESFYAWGPGQLSIVEWSTGLPTEFDCNANGIPDSCEITNGGDCNNNGLLDACETFDQTTPDCNNNSVPDTCDIESGTARDCNLNGVPDSCDIAAGALDENSDGRIDACNYAVGDFDLDNVVNSADLGFLLIFYGEIDPPFGDINGNGICDAEDLGQLLGNYGILP
jgi:hypothetical protein